MKSQYEFARDNVQSIGVGVDNNQHIGGEPVTAQNIKLVAFSKIIIIKLIDGILEVVSQFAILILVALIVMMLFRNFDSKSLLDNYKFEIKKAKDIS